MVYANNPITEDVETAGALGIPGYPLRQNWQKSSSVRDPVSINEMKADEGL